jgi:hypothetical protein
MLQGEVTKVPKIVVVKRVIPRSNLVASKAARLYPAFTEKYPAMQNV